MDSLTRVQSLELNNFSRPFEGWRMGLLPQSVLYQMLRFVHNRRLAWALVHSSRKTDVALGLDASRQLLKQGQDAEGKRDVEYYIAGAGGWRK